MLEESGRKNRAFPFTAQHPLKGAPVDPERAGIPYNSNKAHLALGLIKISGLPLHWLHGSMKPENFATFKSS